MRDRREDGFDALGRGAVDLVHEADVRHAKVLLAGVVAELVPGAMRVADHDVDVGRDEGHVVVPAVPQDHVGLFLCGGQDLGVIDPGEDEVPLCEVRLVLFALLDRAVVCIEILVALETLHDLFRQVAVGHRMTEDGDPFPVLSEEAGDVSRRLALARPGADCADGNDRLRGRELRRLGSEQAVVGTRGQGDRADVHDVLVGDVRVREHDLVGVLTEYDFGELLLGDDGDPLRVPGARELGRIHPTVDVRDLRRGEGDHLDVLTLAKRDVEVVEVAACGAGDHDPGHADSGSWIRSPIAPSSSSAPVTSRSISSASNRWPSFQSSRRREPASRRANQAWPNSSRRNVRSWASKAQERRYPVA